MLLKVNPKTESGNLIAKKLHNIVHIAEKITKISVDICMVGQFIDMPSKKNDISQTDLRDSKTNGDCIRTRIYYIRWPIKNSIAMVGMAGI